MPALFIELCGYWPCQYLPYWFWPYPYICWCHDINGIDDDDGIGVGDGICGGKGVIGGGFGGGSGGAVVG